MNDEPGGWLLAGRQPSHQILGECRGEACALRYAPSAGGLRHNERVKSDKMGKPTGWWLESCGIDLKVLAQKLPTGGNSPGSGLLRQGGGALTLAWLVPRVKKMLSRCRGRRCGACRATGVRYPVMLNASTVQAMQIMSLKCALPSEESLLRSW